MSNSGEITWRSPSNIALVKYWGKREFQLPVNPSISMTLNNSYSKTTVKFNKTRKRKGFTFSFLFHGNKNTRFENKIRSYLNIAIKDLPVLHSLQLDINSENSFPHSAGIASSASAFSSLALCLCSIENEILGINTDNKDLFRKASSLARLGSGSASRSIYGGWVLWGQTTGITGSSDEYAVPLTHLVHKDYCNYYDAILIVNSREKTVKSSLGHKLMETNPYKDAREVAANVNAVNLINALKSGDEKTFCELVENEAANLHAMFLTSKPFFVLIKPETLHIINRLIQFRDKTGLMFSFTLDAGPNIHVIYPGKIREMMLSFIKSDLLPFCENEMWIDDKIGKGPELIYV